MKDVVKLKVTGKAVQLAVFTYMRPICTSLGNRPTTNNQKTLCVLVCSVAVLGACIGSRPILLMAT